MNIFSASDKYGLTGWYDKFGLINPTNTQVITQNGTGIFLIRVHHPEAMEMIDKKANWPVGRTWFFFPFPDNRCHPYKPKNLIVVNIS